MAPVDDERTVLDWMAALGPRVALVAGSYVGTISHTLSALEVLRARPRPGGGRGEPKRNRRRTAACRDPRRPGPVRARRGDGRAATDGGWGGGGSPCDPADPRCTASVIKR